MGPPSSRVLWFLGTGMIASSVVMGWTAYTLRDLPDHIGEAGTVAQDAREVSEARAMREGHDLPVAQRLRGEPAEPVRTRRHAGSLQEALDENDAGSLEELHGSENRRWRERSRLLSERRRTEQENYVPAEEGVQDFAAIHREELSQSGADRRDPAAAYDGEAPLRRSAIVRSGHGNGNGHGYGAEDATRQGRRLAGAAEELAFGPPPEVPGPGTWLVGRAGLPPVLFKENPLSEDFLPKNVGEKAGPERARAAGALLVAGKVKVFLWGRPQKVRSVQDEGAFCRIELEDGSTGWAARSLVYTKN
jgi:hypothetical protein